MKKVLDLSVFEDATLDLRMPDKKMLRIAKPTQQMVIEMLKMRDVDETSEVEKIIKTIDNMVLLILNSNENGEVFTTEYIEESFNSQMKMSVLLGYQEFITGVQSDPN